MPGDGRTVARRIAVIVALVVATVALRGYLPGSDPDTTAPDESSGAGSLAAVVAMLVVSMTVIALSLLKQSPRRRAAAARADLPSGGRGERLPWRLMLTVAAALLAWMALLYLLLRWAEPAVDPPPAASSGDPVAPDATGVAEPPVPPEPADPSTDMFAILAVATLVLVVLTIIAAVRGRRLPAASSAANDAIPSPEPAPSADTDLARAAELGLAEIEDRSRDPRHAIIACYAAMERELGKSPGATPQDSDTPAEVLARAIDTHVLRSGSAGELVELFEEARFSPHVMYEGHRADAVRALRLVQRELAGVT